MDRSGRMAGEEGLGRGGLERIGRTGEVVRDWLGRKEVERQEWRGRDGREGNGVKRQDRLGVLRMGQEAMDWQDGNVKACRGKDRQG